MAVQMKSTVTEKQLKYLGVLSKRGQEVYGEGFSVRKLAQDLGYTWPLSREEASDVIDKTIHIIGEGGKTMNVTEKPEEVDQAPAQNLQLVVQIHTSQEKLQAVKIMLEAMDLDFVVLQEIG